ncbi:MAG: hypothetical protein BroJett018_34180 [Chloroflexota bacterium]|nr:hypothetical protein [Chloroflexota bacterium]GIK65624.1 MAG: hypothetical protein BroJett018_34180 [Chloroflexota bacterium]
MFFAPNRLTHYQAIYGETALHKVGAFLANFLVWMPIMILVIGCVLGELPYREHLAPRASAASILGFTILLWGVSFSLDFFNPNLTTRTQFRSVVVGLLIPFGVAARLPPDPYIPLVITLGLVGLFQVITTYVSAGYRCQYAMGMSAMGVLGVWVGIASSLGSFIEALVLALFIPMVVLTVIPHYVFLTQWQKYQAIEKFVATPLTLGVMIILSGWLIWICWLGGWEVLADL